MKKWNAPEIAVLDLNKTENGIWDYTEEGVTVVLSPCLPIPLGHTNDSLAEEETGRGDGDDKGQGETTESKS